MNDLWESTLLRLQRTISPEAFESWIADIEFGGLLDGRVFRGRARAARAIAILLLVPWFGYQLFAGNSLIGARAQVYPPGKLLKGAKPAWHEEPPRPVTLQQLAHFPIITYEAGYTGRTHIDEAFARRGLPWNLVLSAMDAGHAFAGRGREQQRRLFGGALQPVVDAGGGQANALAQIGIGQGRVQLHRGKYIAVNLVQHCPLSGLSSFLPNIILYIAIVNRTTYEAIGFGARFVPNWGRICRRQSRR